MVKRSFLFMLLIAMCMFSVSAGAKENVSAESEIELLQVLDIVGSDFADNADEPITREEFAVYAAKLNRYTPEANAVRYFNDVSASSELAGYAGQLLEGGIITQPADGMFRAASVIKYNEACCMLVSSMGYAKHAALIGGYPSGYANIAHDLDIRMGGGNAEMTRADAARMIYDALKAYVYNAAYGGKEGTMSFKQGNKTLIEKNFGIAYAEGKLMGTPYGNSESSEFVGNDRVVISGKNYVIKGDVSGLDLLGHNVTYFYDTDSEEILHIAIEKQKKDDLVINIADIQRISGTSVSYNKNGSLKNVNLKTENVIYNGFLQGTRVAEKLADLNKGIVILRDTDRDSQYDMMMVYDYTNLTVGGTKQDKTLVYNKIQGGANLDLTDVEVIEVTKYGEKIDFAEINDGDSLSVMTADNGKVIKIIVNTDEVIGALNSFDGEYAVIDGGEYLVEKSYRSSFLKKVKTGSNAAFVLDPFGNVVYVNVDSEEWQFGYILKRYFEDDDNLGLKILTEDGERKIINLAERVRIDETTYKYTADFEEQLTGLSENIIRFQKNRDGRINKIDTLKIGRNEDKEKSIVSVYEDTKAWSGMGNIGKYGSKAVFTGRTIGFIVPNSYNEGDYAITLGAPDDLSNDGLVIKCYYADTADSDGYVDAYVKKYDRETEKKTITMMYSGKSMGLDDDGDPVYIVKGYSAGKEVEQEISTEIGAESLSALSSLKKGDMVVLTVYAQSLKFCTVEKIFDAETGTPCNFKAITAEHIWYSGTTEEAYYASTNQIVYGEIFDRHGNVFSIRNDENSEVNERFTIPSSLTCVFYDKATDEIYTGSCDNIQDYETARSNCMKVIKTSYWGSVSGVYLYK